MRAGTLMTVLFVAIVAASCASVPPTVGDQVETLRRTITSVVDDADREAEMLDAVDEMEIVFEELGALVERDRVELKQLLRDHETPRSEIEAFLDEHMGQRKEVLGRIADIHFGLKELASPGEWKKLAKAERKALTLIAQRSLGEASLIE